MEKKWYKSTGILGGLGVLLIGIGSLLKNISQGNFDLTADIAIIFTGLSLTGIRKATQ